MKIVVAPNAFKETLTAQEVTDAISTGILKSGQNHKIVQCPIADGGDGSLLTIKELVKGKILTADVPDPLGKPITCNWLLYDKGTACFIETSLIYGLRLLKGDERNPFNTSSHGIGEMIRACLNNGVTKFVIGVGGSANNDAGVGMLQALGFSFKDAYGQEIPRGGIHLSKIVEIDHTKADKRLKKAQFTFLYDSEVPLIGREGVSLMYSMNKGATKTMAENLECAVQNYSNQFSKKYGYDYSLEAGSGSGGGIASAAKHYFCAHSELGSNYFIKLTDLDNLLQDADLLITGEGEVCEQTIYNKAPIAVAKLAHQRNIPVLSINPKIGNNYQKVFEHGITTIITSKEKRTLGIFDIAELTKQYFLENKQPDLANKKLVKYDI